MKRFLLVAGLILLAGCDEPERAPYVPVRPPDPTTVVASSTSAPPTTTTMLGTPPGVPDVTVVVPRAPLPEPELTQVPIAKPQAVVPRVPAAPGPVSTRFSPPVVTTTVAAPVRVTPSPAPRAPAAPTTSRTPAAAPAPAAVKFKNCDAVRAAGKAPIRSGDPGFEAKFDRDGDGVGCEPQRIAAVPVAPSTPVVSDDPGPEMEALGFSKGCRARNDCSADRLPSCWKPEYSPRPGMEIVPLCSSLVFDSEVPTAEPEPEPVVEEPVVEEPEPEVEPVPAPEVVETTSSSVG